MATDPRLLLAGRGLDVGSVFRDVLSNVKGIDAINTQRELAPLRQQILDQQLAAGDLSAQRQQGLNIDDRNKRRLTSLVGFGNQVLPILQGGDPSRARSVALARLGDLTARKAAGEDVDTTETEQFIAALDAKDGSALVMAQQAVDLGRQLNQGTASAAERERQGLLRDLKSDDPQVRDSAEIKLRLKGGATSAAPQIIDIGGVPHIFDKQKNKLVKAQVEGVDVTAEGIGATEAIIAERKERGIGKAKLVGKTIDKGFNQIASINKNIRNIDRAIGALNRGAGTGAVEQFLPSIRAASVELNQIQSELALDVVGATTFGALSAGELDLAKKVALPTGLDEPKLLDWLNRKKTAQTKLRDYFNEQIQFLDGGGTIPEFLAQKEQEQQSAQFNSSTLGREVSEQDIQDTLAANPGLTRDQLFQQLGIQ